jgi:hypothetical protein
MHRNIKWWKRLKTVSNVIEMDFKGLWGNQDALYESEKDPHIWAQIGYDLKIPTNVEAPDTYTSCAPDKNKDTGLYWFTIGGFKKSINVKQ